MRVLRRESARQPGEKDSIDQLEADQLLLQFGKNVAKTESPAPPAAGDKKDSSELKIEHVVATGGKVILLSEAQKLEAVGNFLQFDAADRRVTLRVSRR